MSICYKVDHSKKTGICYLSNPKLFSLNDTTFFLTKLFWWLLKLHSRLKRAKLWCFDCVDLLTSLRLKS